MSRNVSRASKLVVAAVLLLCLAVRVAPSMADSPVPIGTSLGTYSSSFIPPPDPPLNPTPLLQVSGDYSYVAAGTALRNTGYGTITVSYTGTVLAAYLIWTIMDNSQEADLADANINGHAIVGTPYASDYSPCWPVTYIYTYAAPVTSYVLDGANAVSGFATGSTSGANPQDGSPAPADEGAALVVVSSGATSNDIYLYTGTYTEPASGNPISSTFDFGAADSSSATTTFVVSDGQLPNNYADWDGSVVDSNAFPGSAPSSSPTAPWPEGTGTTTYYDVKTYPVGVTAGDTSATSAIGSSSGDCLTWSAQVLSIPSTVSIPPIGVPPSNGVPEFGAPAMAVAAVGVLFVSILAKRKQSLQLPPS